MTAQLFIVRLALAVTLGALIGLERQLRHRRGCSWNALVATGAAVFTMAEQLLPGDPSTETKQIS